MQLLAQRHQQRAGQRISPRDGFSMGSKEESFVVALSLVQAKISGFRHAVLTT